MQDLQLSATERTPEIKFSTSEKTLLSYLGSPTQKMYLVFMEN